jgi:hypothetical protein
MVDQDLGPLVAGIGRSTVGMVTDHSRTAVRWADSVEVTSADFQEEASGAAIASAAVVSKAAEASAEATLVGSPVVGLAAAVLAAEVVLAAVAVGTVADTDKLRS